MQKNYRTKNKKTSNNRTVWVAAALLAVTIGLISLEKFHVINLNSSNSTSNGTKAPTATPQDLEVTPTINLNPSTPDDNSTINQQKEAEKPTATPSPPSSFSGSVTLIRAGKDKADASAQYLQVRGQVSGAPDGICTAIVTPKSGGQAVTQDSSVRNTGTSYDCGILDIPLSKLPAGLYTVMLKLKSGSDTATSATFDDIKI